MCKCTPELRTPFCGKPGCERPKPEGTREAEPELEALTLDEARVIVCRQTIKYLQRVLVDTKAELETRKEHGTLERGMKTTMTAIRELQATLVNQMRQFQPRPRILRPDRALKIVRS